MNNKYSDTVETARQYYNSEDADNFYFQIWGGEDIHIGMYNGDGESIAAASRRTVEQMAHMLAPLDEKAAVIDLGAGYGGSARYLARTFGCSVVALNLSETENARNRDIVDAEGLAGRIEVIDGSFEEVPSADKTFDIVWSQDAFLHSGNREKVIAEAARLLKPGGRLIFTDPMQSEDCSPEELRPVLDRIHLDSLGSVPFYRKAAADVGLKELKVVDYTQHLVTHYRRVRKELLSRRESLSGFVSKSYVERMLSGLGHWVEAGRKGRLCWGILYFQKPLAE